MTSALSPLPIDPHIPAILGELSAKGIVILQAPPGTGKSTRIPPALAKAHSGKILVLEPRRLAARLCADRVSQELGEQVGGRVGYRIRFEAVVSKRTQVEFLTEGLFARLLLGNPTLESVAAVVIDEFHERHVHTDLALAAVKLLQKTSRPDLKLLVMSATLGAEALASFLPAAAVVRLEGRHFDVRIDHLPHSLSLPLEKAVHQAVADLMRDPACPANILVFLSGIAEQRRCMDALLSAYRDTAEILILHSSGTSEEQRRVFAPTQKRKIILATNIAETSLTIDGVTGVVDSGFAKIPVHSPYSGHLEIHRRGISQASAIQRAGRAGRTAAGVCKRLYTAVDYSRMAPYERPEIERLDFTQTLLESKVLFSAMKAKQNLADADSIDDHSIWLSPPTPAAATQAKDLLTLLGALTPQGEITGLGKDMARLPLHPRHSRLLVGAISKDEKIRGVLIAAALSEEFSDLPPAKVSCDLLGAVTSIQGLLRGKGRGGNDRGMRLLENLCGHAGLELRDLSVEVSQEGLAEIALRGFADRVCQRRGATQDEMYVMAQGSFGALSQKSHAVGESVVIAMHILQSEKSGGNFKIEMACPISADAVLALGPSELVSERVVLSWDGAANAVRKKVQTTYGALVMEELLKPLAEHEAVPILSEALRKAWPKPFQDGLEYIGVRERMRLLKSVSKDESLKDLPEEPSREFFEFIAAGKSSFAQVAESTLREYLRDFLSYETWQALESQCPREVQLKGKRQLQIHYQEGRPPWIEAKMQEFFGTAEIPRLASGKVAITIQLLAPNGEAVQTTQDLARFWREGYPSAKATWSRHYPRHFWPEDPLTAPALTHRPRK